MEGWRDGEEMAALHVLATVVLFIHASFLRTPLGEAFGERGSCFRCWGGTDALPSVAPGDSVQDAYMYGCMEVVLKGEGSWWERNGYDMV
jgi:hypothetical protein